MNLHSVAFEFIIKITLQLFRKQLKGSSKDSMNFLSACISRCFSLKVVINLQSFKVVCKDFQTFTALRPVNFKYKAAVRMVRLNFVDQTLYNRAFSPNNIYSTKKLCEIASKIGIK